MQAEDTAVVENMQKVIDLYRVIYKRSTDEFEDLANENFRLRMTVRTLEAELVKLRGN